MLKLLNIDILVTFVPELWLAPRCRPNDKCFWVG